MLSSTRRAGNLGNTAAVIWPRTTSATSRARAHVRPIPRHRIHHSAPISISTENSAASAATAGGKFNVRRSSHNSGISTAAAWISVIHLAHERASGAARSARSSIAA